MNKETLDRIRKYIDKKKDVQVIAKELQMQDYEVYGLVQLLINQGYLYEIVDGQIVKLSKPRSNNDVYKIDNNLEHIKLLLISDTHLCSKYDRLDILRYLYKKAEEENVNCVLHSGDFTDGKSNRPEHVYELKEHSYQGQIDYCVKNYPKADGIKTYVIGGNHDGWWYKSSGSDIVKQICSQRDDLIYLGPDVADLQIGKLRVRLFHGKGGSAYSRSYKVQKYLDSIPMKERPHILQTGHIHQAFYMKQDTTHCFQTACLEDQTPFCRGMGLQNEKSVWWVDVYFDEKGNPVRIKPELEEFGARKLTRR